MEKKPLSPHLQIYRWEITMITSVLHRLTGLYLWLIATLSLFWLADSLFLEILPWSVFSLWWLVVAMDSLWAYLIFAELTAVVFSLFFHGLNGVRHLLWDLGIGYGLTTARGSAWLVLLLSITATGFFIFIFFTKIIF